MDLSEVSDAIVVEERRKKMLERLNARHLQPSPSNEMSEKSFGPKELENLQNQAKVILSDPSGIVDPALLQKLESALSLISSGFQLRRLRDLHGQLRSRLQQNKVPASVFSFTSKQQPVTNVNVSTQSVETMSPQAMSMAILRSKNSKIVSNLINEKLQLKGADGEDIAIMDVNDSSIVADFEASTVHLKAVKNSVIVLAPVHSSVMIRDCSELVLVAAAQQIRIHNSYNACLHIAVRGAVIIEECDGIKVAPYRVKGIELDWHNDNWKDVKDFSWLAVAEPNPHWSVMEEESWQIFDLSVV